MLLYVTFSALEYESSLSNALWFSRIFRGNDWKIVFFLKDLNISPEKTPIDF